MVQDMICIYGMNQPLLDLSIKHCRCTYLAIYSSSIYLRKRKRLFIFYASLTQLKEFVGLLNNGNVSFPITNTSSSADAVVRGFNFNPYPSSIDWKSGTGWLRTDLVVSGGGYDMWIWNCQIITGL
jgi:hypothetical protein